MAAVARHGTAKKPFRAAKPARTYPVIVRKHVEDRARLELDGTAQIDLALIVGDRLCSEVTWSDGSLMTAIEVYAVHPRGAYTLVDVRGFDTLGMEVPPTIRLRRWT